MQVFTYNTSNIITTTAKLVKKEWDGFISIFLSVVVAFKSVENTTEVLVIATLAIFYILHRKSYILLSE